MRDVRRRRAAARGAPGFHRGAHDLLGRVRRPRSAPPPNPPRGCWRRCGSTPPNASTSASDELREWYFRNVARNPVPVDLVGWTREAGYPDPGEFHRDVFAASTSGADAGGVRVSGYLGEYLPARWAGRRRHPIPAVPTGADPVDAVAARGRLGGAPPGSVFPGPPTNACTSRTPSTRKGPTTRHTFRRTAGRCTRPCHRARGPFRLPQPGTRAFTPRHMYGTIRFVLDAWERYFGAEIPWHFAEDLDRLELVPSSNGTTPNADTASSKRASPTSRPPSHPFCLDFDVLAHELGHAFIYSLLGLPPPGAGVHRVRRLPRVRGGLRCDDRRYCTSTRSSRTC